MDKKNTGGWKTCSRGHRYQGSGPCPICWKGGKKAFAQLRDRFGVLWTILHERPR